MPKKNLFEEYKKNVGWEKYDTYKVKIRLKDLVGGIPMNPALVESWVNARNRDKTKAEREAIRDAHLDMLKDVTDDTKERNGIGFHRVDGQLCIEGRQVKAMLKECANVIKNIVPTGKREKGKMTYGTGALKSKVAERLFVDEEIIPIDRTEPDDVCEKPIHVDTAQGPRDSLKVFEICQDVEIEFTIRRLKDTGKRAVTETMMWAILDYAQDNGLGADRSQGRGTFEVTDAQAVV